MAIKLTSSFVESVTAPRRYTDANMHGLSLLVKPSKGGISKSWSQYLRIDRKPRNIGLGAYPGTKLAEARKRAKANALAAANGAALPFDGIMGRNAIADTSIPTFAEVAERTIASRNLAPATARNWRSALACHAAPLADKPINAIGQRDVINIVLPLNGSKMGRNVRTYLRACFAFAISNEWCTVNPAGDAIDGAIVAGKASTEHHAALHHAAVAGALAKVRSIDTSGWKGLTLAFQFMVHTASRHETTLGARWSEIDMDRAVWTIPASRMKARRAHVVPLTGQALSILREARELGGTVYVFRGITGERAPDGSLRRVRDAAGIKCRVHGFRASFGAWCVETGQDDYLSECALAHVADSTKRAYKREVPVERIRPIMEAWSAYIAA